MRPNPKKLSLARAFSLIAALVIITTSAFAQRRERLIDAWRPTHFDIDITFDQDLTSLHAATSVDVAVLKDATSVIDLDFGKMPVSAVTVGSQPARFVQHDEKLDVYLSTPAQRSQALRITVSYAG